MQMKDKFFCLDHHVNVETTAKPAISLLTVYLLSAFTPHCFLTASSDGFGAGIKGHPKLRSKGVPPLSLLTLRMRIETFRRLRLLIRSLRVTGRKLGGAVWKL